MVYFDDWYWSDGAINYFIWRLWHPTEEASISFWKKIYTQLKKIPAYFDV